MAGVANVTVELGAESRAELARLTAAIEADEARRNEIADLQNAADISSRLQRLLAQRRTVYLPSGRYVLDASTLEIPPGCRLLSTGGAVIECHHSPASHPFVRLSSGVRVGGITFEALGGPPTGTGAIMIGIDAEDVYLTEVTIRGTGETGLPVIGAQTGLSLWGCRNVRAHRLRVTGSVCGAYGVEIIGGADHVYTLGDFSANSADGVKVMGSAAYGIPRRMLWESCEANYNGRAVAGGEFPIDRVIDQGGSGSQVIPGPGRWFVRSVSRPLSLVLPSAPGIYVLKIGKPGAPVRVTYGAHVVALTNPRLVYRFTCDDAAQWTADNWTNGEGWDVSGVDLAWDRCRAEVNSGGGFQVKPGTVAGSDTSGIRYRECVASRQIDGNGFAVVNNSAGTVVPTDILYDDCRADDNAEAGFAVTTGLARHVQWRGGSADRNGGAGVLLQEWTRDARLAGVRLAGNGVAQGGAGYNLVARGGHRIHLADLFVAGVSATGSPNVVDAAYNDRQRATCRGAYLLADTGAGETAQEWSGYIYAHNVPVPVCDVYANPSTAGDKDAWYPMVGSYRQ